MALIGKKSIAAISDVRHWTLTQRFLLIVVLGSFAGVYTCFDSAMVKPFEGSNQTIVDAPQRSIVSNALGILFYDFIPCVAGLFTLSIILELYHKRRWS